MAEHPVIKTVKLYKDSAGEWRFSGIASNSLTIVDSSEGYKNREDAIGALQGVFGTNVTIEVDEK